MTSPLTFSAPSTHTHSHTHTSPRKALRVAIVGSPSPPEGDPDSGSSSDGSSEEEGPATLPATPLKSLPSNGTPNPAEMSTMEAYGFEIQEPSLSDCLLYER